MKKTDEAQEKIDFFLVSAHELRTSLSAMKWLFKMLLDGDLGNLNETQKAMLTQASNSNEHMIELVNDTMTVVNTDGASASYKSVPFEFTKLVDTSIKDFTSEAAAKGIHIRYTPPISPVIIKGDEDKLRIAVHNLLENAIKYGTTDTDITLALTPSEHKAVFSVANQGVGIPTAEQSQIFEKFFRASNVKEGFVGVGLGLYATKHIIERHGGTLGFTSAEGTTTFTVELPLA